VEPAASALVNANALQLRTNVELVASVAKIASARQKAAENAAASPDLAL
jgi:hypothetical protein